MNDRPLHDDTHQEETVTPIPPVWRRFHNSSIMNDYVRRWCSCGKEDEAIDICKECHAPPDTKIVHEVTFKIDPDPEPDEPTGHAEIIQELIKRVNALESRVMLLESLNKDKFFEQLTPAYVSDPIHTSPTIEG